MNQRLRIPSSAAIERQRGKGKGTEPDTAEWEGSEAAIGFNVCAKAATVGEAVLVMKMTTAQCYGRGTSHHWQCPSLRSGLGFVGGEV